MKRMLQALALIAASATAQDPPCVVDGGPWYRYEDRGGGTTRVIEVYTWYPTGAETETLKGDFTRAELQAYYHGLLADSALVFIARIDSVIQMPKNDTSRPLLPWKTLVRTDTLKGMEYYRFYARLQVDTVLRGALPGNPASFWIESERPQACQFDWKGFKGKSFLNASKTFEKTSDLKLDLSNGSVLPQRAAHWFDGRYLSTPPYYGLRLDITHVLPTYPATGIAPRRPPGRVPAAPAGKTWLPDGRAADGRDARENPVPLLK